MGGGQSTTTTVTPVTASTPELHLEPWFAEMKYENSSTVSEGLSSCYGAMEAAWTSRLGNYKLVSDIKLKHSYSSCKSYLELALHRELSVCQDNGQYWYTINVASSATSTVLFVFMTILLARLRRSNRIKNKLKRHLPDKFWKKTKKTRSWFHRKCDVDSMSGPTATSTSSSTSAFSNSTAQNGDYHYIMDNPYKPSGQYDNIIGVTQMGPGLLQQSQTCTPPSSYPTRKPQIIGSNIPLPGTPITPYPTQMARGATIGSNPTLPVPAARQLGEIPFPRGLQVPHRQEDMQGQAEALEGGQTLQGAEMMDRNLHIAEKYITNKDTHY